MEMEMRWLVHDLNMTWAYSGLYLVIFWTHLDNCIDSFISLHIVHHYIDHHLEHHNVWLYHNITTTHHNIKSQHNIPSKCYFSTSHTVLHDNITRNIYYNITKWHSTHYYSFHRLLERLSFFSACFLSRLGTTT